MKKILFLIHDLGNGGAEKVLVNLVNNMDRNIFDITVLSLFGGGINEQFLKSDIHYSSVFKKSFPGNTKLFKLLSPQVLHKLFIKQHYDIEVSYLEGPCARIISGCTDSGTSKYCWIHVEHHSLEKIASPFRSKKEAIICYNKFDKIVFVSNYVKEDFLNNISIQVPNEVAYNTVESEKIISDSKETISSVFSKDEINIIAVGTLKKSKGYERLLKIIKQLTDEKYNIHLYILGEGPLRETLLNSTNSLHLNESVSFLGYDTNPYKYVAKADLFVCASFAEGFSTAATESLIVGTPVCTVDVSGMKEMLGENNEYGIVTENTEEALYEGIKALLDSPKLLAHYKQKAIERGSSFKTSVTVEKVQCLFLDSAGENK